MKALMLVDVRSTKDLYAEDNKFYGVVVKGFVFLWDETSMCARSHDGTAQRAMHSCLVHGIAVL